MLPRQHSSTKTFRLKAAAVALVVAFHVAVAPRLVYAQPAGILATVTYTGQLGPVSGAWPLCLCVHSDPELRQRLGCFIAYSNRAAFDVTPLGTNQDYYFI